MTFKQFMKKAVQEKFDVENFDLVVDFNDGEDEIEVTGISLDSKNKKVRITTAEGLTTD